MKARCGERLKINMRIKVRKYSEKIEIGKLRVVINQANNFWDQQQTYKFANQMAKIHKEPQETYNTSTTEDFQDNNLIQDNEIDQSSSGNRTSQYPVSFQNTSPSQNQHLKSSPPTTQSLPFQYFPLISFLILIVLVISASIFYKQFFKFLLVKLDIVEKETHFKTASQYQIKKIDPFLIQNSYHLIKDITNICPNSSSTFHVFIDQIQHINSSFSIDIQNQLQLCNLPILGENDLYKLKEKWNHDFPQLKININQIQQKKQKQLLLALLKLYFSGGTYINIRVPYSKIQNRCLEYALTGFETLFVEFEQKNTQNIYIPNPHFFMKVRFPFSPFIKLMIDKIIKKQDFLSSCRKKQCLIVKCLS